MVEVQQVCYATTLIMNPASAPDYVLMFSVEEPSNEGPALDKNTVAAMRRE